MKDLNYATVISIIEAINKGEIKVKDVSDFFGKSERTVQKHVKNLGFIWNAKQRTYTKTGENYMIENDEKIFSEIINPSPINNLNKSNNGRKNSTIKVNNNSNSNVTLPKHDSIDSILFGDSINNSRVQRAYYLDNDIATIIDNVEGKQKSNLVNECLRKVFTEKGLL